MKEWDKEVKISCHATECTAKLGGENKAAQPIFGKSSHTSNQQLKVSHLIEWSKVKV